MIRKNRLLFVAVTLLSMWACSGMDQKKFDGASRAAKTLEGACAVGINYYKFVELLQGLAGEVNILKDEVKSKKEKELADLYLKMVGIYKDSADLWKAKIESAKYDFIRPGNIVIGGDLLQIVDKYKLQKVEHEGPSGLVVVSDESILIVWKRASQYIKRTDDFLAGRSQNSKIDEES